VLASCGLIALVFGAIAGAWGRTPAGNTALIVPYVVGPAIVTAGWVVLAVLGDERERRRLALSVAAFALAGLVLALLLALLPLVASAAGAPPLASLILLAVPLVLGAPVGAALAARHERPRPGRGWGAMPLVVALLVVVIFAPTGVASAVAPLFVPVVLVAPLAPDVQRTGAQFERIGGAVLLPIVVISGLFAGMAFTG
jgi:hypothetical protein